MELVYNIVWFVKINGGITMFVGKWEKENKDFRKQEERETSYSVTFVDTEKIFQIQTYGPKGYEAGPKQVIQFDKKRAMQLIDILRKEYNL